MNTNNLLKFTIFFTVLTLSLFACTLSTFIMQAVSYYHVSATQAGTLESYQNLSMIVFLLTLFSLILKLGYRYSLILIVTLMVVIAILMPLVKQYFMLKIYLVGLGLVFVAMKVIVYSTAPLMVKDESGQAMLLSFLEFSWALASLIGMWIMAHFINNYPHHWLYFTWVFALAGICCIGLWIIVKLDESAIKKEQDLSISRQLKAIFDLCRNRYVLALIIITFLANFVEMGFSAWLPGFYQQAINISGALAVQIASFSLFATMLGRVCVIGLLKLVSFGKALFIFYFSGLCVLITALFSLQIIHTPINSIVELPLPAVLLGLFAFFLAPSSPVLNASILAHTNKNKHLLLMTVLTIVFALASSIGARLIGELIDNLGIINGFKFATIIPLFLLLILILPYEKFIHKGFVN